MRSRTVHSLRWHIGDVVAKLRQQKDWTAVELADRAGISKNTITDIEKGRTRGSKRLGIIAKTLGSTVEEMLALVPVQQHFEGHVTAESDSQEIHKNHIREEQMSSDGDTSSGQSDVLQSHPVMAHHLPGSAFHAIQPSRAISASEERLGNVADALEESAEDFREAITNLEALAKAFSASLAKLETGDQTASAGHQSSKSTRPRK